jgi:hypothetical protein
MNIMKIFSGMKGLQFWLIVEIGSIINSHNTEVKTNVKSES